MAPIRYHTLDQSNFMDEPSRYREMKETAIAMHTFIGPHGLWYTQVQSSPLRNGPRMSA